MEATQPFFASRRPARCPACGSPRVATIFYGMPSSDVVPDLDSGKIVLGGCCLSPHDPSWQCVVCDTDVYPAHMRQDYLDDPEAF